VLIQVLAYQHMDYFIQINSCDGEDAADS